MGASFLRVIRVIRVIRVVAALALVRASAAQASDPVAYELADPSKLAYGCMGPCACPVIFTGAVKGGMTLTLDGVSPLYTHYAVTDIAWSYVVPGTSRVAHVTGRGGYQVGGEFAAMQRMELDLVTDGTLQQHFDSGLVPGGGGFPAIDIEIHVHVNECIDSVFRVVASPATASAGPRSPRIRIAAAPNPSRAGVEVVVALPEAGAATVEVLDVHGRTLVTLADRRFPEGDTALHWDGRTRTGGDAGVGVFWLRVRTGSRAVANRIVRFR